MTELGIEHSKRTNQLAKITDASVLANMIKSAIEEAATDEAALSQLSAEFAQAIMNASQNSVDDFILRLNFYLCA